MATGSADSFSVLERDENSGPSVPDRSYLLFLALLWGQLFYSLAPSWVGLAHYDYGWLVAPFFVLFFWRRWEEAEPRWQGPLHSPGRWFWGLVVVAVILLIPLRVVQYVDSFWRLPLWLHGGVVVFVTHLSLLLLYGPAVSRYLLPASLFALLAIPLPIVLQRELVQGLTHQVVQLASSVLPYLGYPVDVAGNSLVVKGELLDVAEGCSGIRSFQSSAMAGFCLGELLRLSAVRRILLVIFALGFAVLLNTGRIIILARIGHDEGRAASDAAHDSVGFWVLILTFGGLSLLAWLLSGLGNSRKTIRRTISS